MDRRPGQRPFQTVFSRLITAFLAVMLLPIILLSAYYISTGKKSLTNNLTEQGETDIARAADRFKTYVENYRHKAYLISMSPVIMHELASDSPEDSSKQSTTVYEELFKIMRGDTYLASASVVSTSGRVRYSTHLFPDRYDLRYHGNDTNPFFDLSRADTSTASIITTGNRYATANNTFVFMNILRRVRGENDTVTGYVVVDVFQEAISSLIDGMAFKELILIDTENYTAGSLVHTERSGDFSRFPELSTVSLPPNASTFTHGNTIVSLAPVANTPLMLAGIIDIQPYEQSVAHFFLIIVAVVLLGTLLAGIFAFFAARSIAKPVGNLASSMQQVQSGDLTARAVNSSIREIDLLNTAFNTMVERIESLIILTREEEAKLHEAERKALESQMNPHFLYNTLNTVKAIAKSHGEQEILTITSRLGKLLRSSIDNREAEIPLRDSLELTDSYLTIQKIRYGDKLQVTKTVDESVLDQRTPKLIIQPLIENAIVHGLEPKTGEWQLDITVAKEAGSIVIQIRDNGIGLEPQAIPGNLDDQRQTTHIGIRNIKDRLKLRYGDAASLSYTSCRGEGTMATLVLPLAFQKEL